MAIVHHTAGASTDYSVQRAYAISRSIQNSHFDRGWVDARPPLATEAAGLPVEAVQHQLNLRGAAGRRLAVPEVRQLAR